MKYLKHIVIPLFLFVISCSIDNKTLLTIGDSQYSVEDFKQAFTFEPNDDSIAKRGKIEDYVNQMLVYEEAKSLGYEDDPVVRAAYETNEKDIIWRSYYNDEVVAKINVRDSEIRELYNKIIDQYHLSQIVVAEESLANYLEAELRKGTSFEDLQAYSLDTLSE
jgi:parvulin-like peptidyl-prolyl isomerase